MNMRTLLTISIAAAALLASACQAKAPDDAEAAADAAAAACSTSRTLAQTEVCGGGDVAVFRQVSDHPIASPKCVWYTEQLMLSDSEFLVFRNQDCSEEGWDGAAYKYANGVVTLHPAPTPDVAGDPILEIFPIDTGVDPQAFSTTKLEGEADATRCMVRPIEDLNIPGTLWELAPNDEYMAELNARNEPWSACGKYGSGESTQFWEMRKDVALYHWLGQDAGYWDPASFTFYRKGADGKFAKVMD
jgi:hypothetical protein